jgi:Escherichia/Staphylococcus phage prohead protease
MSELTIERSLAAGALEPVGDGWTVYGLAVPYGVDQRVTDDGVTYYRERFAVGAFARDVLKGGRWINLFLGHKGDEGDRWLGRCVALTETDEGIFPSFRINREHPQAEAARSGDLTKWSVSARVYRTRREAAIGGDDVVIRELCGLSHVAATAHPQYAGAGVLVAREHELITSTSSTPRLDALRAAGYGSH